jgi:hypothetical protein
MDNTATSTTVGAMTNREKKLHNFLLALKHEFDVSGKDGLKFDAVRDLALLYDMSDKHIAAMNANYVLLRDGNAGICFWNKNNPHIRTVIRGMLTKVQEYKTKEKQLVKDNAKLTAKIPVKYKPLNALAPIAKPKVDGRNGRGPQTKTVEEYVKFVTAMYDAKEITTLDMYALIKKYKISAETRTCLERLGVIVTIKGVVMWDNNVRPSEQFAYDIITYVNAKAQKRPLPTFDLKKYNTVTPVVKVVAETVIAVENKAIDTVKVSEVKTETEKQEKTPEPVTMPEASVQTGSDANINVLLAQELIMQGGDKALAYKLLKNQI